MSRAPIKFVVSTLLILAGGWIVYQMSLPASSRTIPEGLQSFSWLAPAVSAFGLVMLLRNSGWGRCLSSSRRLLMMGAILFVAGFGFAGLQTATDPGGDASWVNGSLAMASAILVGLPGLALMLAGLAIKSQSR